jgi:hypothetical protein
LYYTMQAMMSLRFSGRRLQPATKSEYLPR